MHCHCAFPSAESSTTRRAATPAKADDGVCAVLASLIPILWASGIGSDVMKPIAAPMVGGMAKADCRTLLGMAVKVEMHNTGDLELQRDVVASVEHILSERPGEWQVLIVGS